MNGLITKKKLELMMTPPSLTRDFEAVVFDAYCNYGYTNLQTITELADDFAVYAESFEVTGDPFTFTDDDAVEETFLMDIRVDRFFEVAEDAREVLMYHHMFFFEKDYNFLGFYNMPVMEVW